MKSWPFAISYWLCLIGSYILWSQGWSRQERLSIVVGMLLSAALWLATRQSSSADAQR